jgi:hypothetical protein
MPAQEDKICLMLILDDVKEGMRRVASALWRDSVHTVYIDPVRCGTVHSVGQLLAEQLRHQGAIPEALSEAQRDELRHLRGSYAFRAETDPRVSMHASDDLDGWTVICEEDVLFAIASAPRQIYVKPMPSHWNEALFLVQHQLDGAALWPEGAEARGLPEMRISPLGT